MREMMTPLKALPQFLRRERFHTLETGDQANARFPKIVYEKSKSLVDPGGGSGE